LKNPQTYIPECDEIKVCVLWFQGIDPYSHNLFYTFKEVKSGEIPEATPPEFVKGENKK
jgi:hypothetical protein